MFCIQSDDAIVMATCKRINTYALRGEVSFVRSSATAMKIFFISWLGMKPTSVIRCQQISGNQSRVLFLLNVHSCEYKEMVGWIYSGIFFRSQRSWIQRMDIRMTEWIKIQMIPTHLDEPEGLDKVILCIIIYHQHHVIHIETKIKFLFRVLYVSIVEGWLHQCEASTMFRPLLNLCLHNRSSRVSATAAPAWLTQFGLWPLLSWPGDVRTNLPPVNKWLYSPLSTATGEVLCCCGPDRETVIWAPSGP